MAAQRERGALVHSYLDDGPAMQFAHYGGYVGWAALELHAVEGLIGARLAHCYGGLVPDPRHRAIVGLALDDLRGRDSLGSMVYGNTVDYDGRRDHDLAVLSESVMVDVATQLHRPTGHAVNPVPLTEAERIPSAEEILEVQLIARELEREVRRGAALLDWAAVERRAAEVAAHARAFRDGVLAELAAEGVDVGDAAQLLLALRRSAPAELEERVRVAAPAEVRRAGDLEARRGGRASPSARGAARRRSTACGIVLASLEVHDVVRDALARVLPRGRRRGDRAAQLGVGRAAGPGGGRRGRPRDRHRHLQRRRADAGPRARQRPASRRAARRRSSSAACLNEDDGGPLPVDARPALAALGIRCVERDRGAGPAARGGLGAAVGFLTIARIPAVSPGWRRDTK